MLEIEKLSTKNSSRSSRLAKSTGNGDVAWAAILFVCLSSLYFATNVSRFNLPPRDSQAFAQEESLIFGMVKDKERSQGTSTVPLFALDSTSMHKAISKSQETTEKPLSGSATKEYDFKFEYEKKLLSGYQGDIGRLGNDKSSYCHFEDANGHFRTVDGTMTWDWIHNSSLSKGTGKNCAIVNQIEKLTQHKYNTSKPLAIITIGDSLDRNIVIRWLCGPDGEAEKAGFELISQRKMEPSLSPELAALVNQGNLGKFSSGICTNHNISFAFFKIFGMHHDCDDEGYMYQEDSRMFDTTAERVKRLFDFELLSRFSKDTNFVVMVSSALWDLSRGKACNNQVGVSEKYRELYRVGMVQMHATIRKLLPNAPIYWKTSPAVSVEYDKKTTIAGFGRTRANQEVLNNLMRKTVSDYNLGVVVDWWTQANQRSEEERGVLDDGRHYKRYPSVAFYNMFLNAVFDHNPELIQ